MEPSAGGRKILWVVTAGLQIKPAGIKTGWKF